ncbi:hypothetical protein OAK37_00100 [bacterium]|jgi:hypothetical protein|nr:hypothetical protein [bacterium]
MTSVRGKIMPVNFAGVRIVGPKLLAFDPTSDSSVENLNIPD